MRRLRTIHETTTQLLRPSFELGRADTRRSPASWVVLGALVVACAASFSIAAVLWGVPLLGGPIVEAPVPDGPWLFEWGSHAAPPSVEQQGQVRALRTVAAGAATLVAVLCLLVVAGLWRQRLLLRRREHLVHWAVGALQLQAVARLAGEARIWAGAAVGAALLGTAAVAAFIDRSFPGAASVTPNVAASAILVVALAVVLVRWESRAGHHAHEADRSRFWELVGSPPMIGAVGFAALSGMGLLAVHAPYGQWRTTEVAGSVAAASLAGIPMDTRADRILEWTASARTGDADLGFASAGASRGTGRRDQATVQCGECFEGLVYLPLKIVSAEIFAVAPDTFTRLGMNVAAGRDFDDAIDRGPPSAAIVSRALAARHFEDGEPLGRKLMVGESGWLTVVGVVDGRDGFAIYLPLAQARPTDIEILSPGPVTSLGAALATAPPGAVVARARSIAEVFPVHRWFQRLLNGMGVAALVLLGGGLWISAANEAGAARHEIAVRRAVGATRRTFWAFYLGFAGRRLAFALLVGAWLSLFLGAGLEMAYASIPRIDWRIWCGAAAWVSSMYVAGSLKLMIRAATEPLMGALESAA